MEQLSKRNPGQALSPSFGDARVMSDEVLTPLSSATDSTIEPSGLLPAPTGTPIVEGDAAHFSREHLNDIQKGREIFALEQWPAPTVSNEMQSWPAPQASEQEISGPRGEAPARWAKLRKFSRFLLSKQLERLRVQNG